MASGEEDDDFGDFGGFEVAEPVLPNVAQVEPQGVEASPSPWAVFPSGASSGSARPDLLCGQNRFPPVLDPSVPNNNNSADESAISVNGTSAQENENVEDVSLANDILDGSFRSSSSPLSSLGAAADLISNINTGNGSQNDSQPVDLVEASDSQINSQPIDLVEPSSSQNSSQPMDLVGPSSSQNNSQPFELVRRSNSGAMAADIISNINQEDNSQLLDFVEGAIFLPLSESADLFGNLNTGDSSQTNAQPVDLVGGLTGASPGIVLIEDNSVDPENFDISHSDSVLVKNTDETIKEEPYRECSVKASMSQSMPQVSPLSRSPSQSSGHSGNPLLIDSLRKAVQPKHGIDMARLTGRQSQTETSRATPKEPEQSLTNTHVDTLLLEELRQSRTESQAAITQIVDQYKDLSKQCISKQEEVLKECKVILQQEQESQIQDLVHKLRQEFEKVIEDEKDTLRKQASETLAELVCEQKVCFEQQLEEEKKLYENKFKEAIEEERTNCRQKLQESLEAERVEMKTKLESEKIKMKEELEEEKKRLLDEMKTALKDEREINKESLRISLVGERDHCRDCLKISVAEVKQDMQNYLLQQKQRDRVVRQRQLSSLDIFLETARQQLNFLMEENQSENLSELTDDGTSEKKSFTLNKRKQEESQSEKPSTANTDSKPDVT